MSKKSIQEQLIESVLDDSDDAGFMAKSNLYDAIKNAIQLHRIIKDTDSLEPWILEKIALAADYIDTVKDYVEYRSLHSNEFQLNGEYRAGHGHHEYEESALSEDGEQQDPNAAQDPTQNQAAPAQAPAPAPQDGALAVEPATPAPTEQDLSTVLSGIKAIQKYAKNRGDLDPEFDKEKLVKLITKKIEGTTPQNAEHIANFIFDDVKESAVMEKAVSKAQQRFMGMVHAAQKGEKPASKEVAKVAKDMPKKAAKDYAKTTHKGLPDHVKETEAKLGETSSLMDEWSQYKLSTTRSTSNESVDAEALARVAKMFAGKK
jgi:hypothetical protein